VFLDNGYTKEEEKMINETRKILHKPDLKITATTVRVPVLNSHSESINVEFENDFDIEDIKNLLKNSPGIILQDDPKNNVYPLATNSTGSDSVYVGRVRRDDSCKYGINMWVVADNIRKGAAANAIQIMEKMILKL
jgi:aspartate-semialdehyde dehydrogenase